jgi:hypothetical protein
MAQEATQMIDKLLSEKNFLESKIKVQLETIQGLTQQKNQLAHQLSSEQLRVQTLAKRIEALERYWSNALLPLLTTNRSSAPVDTSVNLVLDGIQQFVVPDNSSSSAAESSDSEEEDEEEGDRVVIQGSWMSSIPLFGRFVSRSLKKTNDIVV